MPKMTVFYINQASLNYKDNKKIYYYDVHIVGQVIPMLNASEDIKNFVPLANEAKIVRLKYDVVTGEFLGLVETLGYLIVCGGERECFFDYGYNKQNINILYSTQKIKIPNSFLPTIFNRHKIQYEAGAHS